MVVRGQADKGPKYYSGIGGRCDVDRKGSVIGVGAGVPAKQAARRMARASPVFAGTPAPTVIAPTFRFCARQLLPQGKAALAEALFSARQRSPKGWVISHRGAKRPRQSFSSPPFSAPPAPPATVACTHATPGYPARAGAAGRCAGPRGSCPGGHPSRSPGHPGTALPRCHG